jgi:hypothetical protein
MENYWLPWIGTGIIALFTTPNAFLLLGPSILDIAIATRSLHTFLKSMGGSIGPIGTRLLDLGGSMVLPRLLSVPASEIATWSSSRIWENSRRNLIRLAASSDVAATFVVSLHGLSQLPNLAALLPAYLLWQVQSTKYTLSQTHRDVWSTTDNFFRQLLANPSFPTVLATSYNTISTFARRQVRSPDDLQRQAREESLNQNTNAGNGGLSSMFSNMASQAQKSCSVQ